MQEMACILVERGPQCLRGTARGGSQWLGQSKLFKLVGQRRLEMYKRVVNAREYRVAHPKMKLNVCVKR